MAIAGRDHWVRERWGSWLNHCIHTDPNLSLNALSRELARGGLGDYRGNLKSYLRREATVEPDKAFAITAVSPGTWISGPYAVAIAGYYEHLISFLEQFNSAAKDDLAGIPILVARHVPFIAELELSMVLGFFRMFGGASSEAAKSEDEAARKFTKAVFHGSQFLRRAGVIRFLGRKTGVGSSIEAVIQDSWDSRHIRLKYDGIDEFAFDREALIELSRSAARHRNLSPDRLCVTLLNFLWQWLALVDRDSAKEHRYEIDVLADYHAHIAEAKYIHQNRENYTVTEIIPGIRSAVASKSRVLNVSLDKRLDDLKQYAATWRRHYKSMIRLSHVLSRHSEYKDAFECQESLFADRLDLWRRGDGGLESVSDVADLL